MFDPKTQQIVDSPEANALIQRTYRADEIRQAPKWPATLGVRLAAYQWLAGT